MKKQTKWDTVGKPCIVSRLFKETTANKVSLLYLKQKRQRNEYKERTALVELESLVNETANLINPFKKLKESLIRHLRQGVTGRKLQKYSKNQAHCSINTEHKNVYAEVK